MICLELNWFVYDPSWMLHLSEFVWTLRSSVWVVFNNFLLIDATDRSKISSDQKRLFFAVNLYPLTFFVNTPFKTPPKFINFGHFSVAMVTLEMEIIQKRIFFTTFISLLFYTTRQTKVPKLHGRLKFSQSWFMSFWAAQKCFEFLVRN